MKHGTSRWSALACASALCVAVTASPARGAADPPDASGCGAELRAWADACARSAGRAVTPTGCRADGATIRIADGSPGGLSLDLSASGRPAFRTAGSIGVSPIGEFPEWEREPAERRAALDATLACVRDDASVLDRARRDAEQAARAASQATRARPALGARSARWALLGIAMAALAALVFFGVRGRARLAAWLSAASGAGAEPGREEAGPEGANTVSTATSPRRRLHVGPWASVAFLASLAWLELSAIRGVDPDFYLPDPFHGFALGLLVLFGVAALTPFRQLRNALLALAIAAPIGVSIGEWRLGAGGPIGAYRIQPSDDPLLRYQYRPGVEFGGTTVTPDGLLDVAHVVPKPRDVDRVVVLGDSVPNDPSIPFADRFPRKLEALLSARAPAGRRVDVVNVSCEGYDTVQEVELLERVGLAYQPDVVVVAYVLNDPFMQNGGYRRLGNSFFLFRLATLWGMASRQRCETFAPMHEGYGFDLVVRASFERLRLMSKLHGFEVVVAPLPIVAPFDDPTCGRMFDQVLDVGRAQGFDGVRLVDGFRGEDYRAYAKPGQAMDITHPSAAAHAKIAAQMADAVAKHLWR